MKIDYETGEISTGAKRPNVGPYASMAQYAALHYVNHPDLTDGDFRVIVALMGMAGDSGSLPYTATAIAEKIGRNISGVARSLKRLCRAGFIIKQTGRTGYMLNPYAAWNVDSVKHKILARQVDRHYETCIMEAGTTKGNHHDRLQT